MTLEHLLSFCENLPKATPEIKLGDHLTFTIGGKVFLFIGQESVPVGCSFKCMPEDFEALCEREGFKQAAYLARNQWVYCADIGLLTAEDADRYIRRSYELIRAKLPKKWREDV